MCACLREAAPLVFGKASASSRATARQLTEDGVDLDGAENNKWQDVDMHEGASDDEDDTGHVQVSGVLSMECVIGVLVVLAVLLCYEIKLVLLIAHFLL